MNIKLLKLNKKYIIGVSGGIDSMFLLDNIFNNIKLDINNFIVCFVNYQKRKDSNKDEKNVIKYCKKRNIKIFIKKILIDEYKKYYLISHNFQCIARDLRYDFFLKINKKYHCDGVLIAHNLIDNIETYILQKKRKNIVEYYGLNEISYYYSKFFKEKLKILRIMLNITRKEIMEYLFKNKINYVIDSTNNLMIYNRNIIRNEIKNINLQNILLEIKQKNIENKKLKLIAKNYLINNFYKIIPYSFNNFNNIKLKKIIIFNYFKKNNFINLIINKKRKFLDEIIKELKSLKPNIIITINKKFSLIKSYNNIEIINNNILKSTTKKIFSISDLPLKWKKNIIYKGTKNKHIFKITLEQFPIIITNDLLILKKVLIFKLTLNRWFIKNKIPLLARRNYFILDKNKNLIYVNNLIKLEINKFINNTLIKNNNLFFFMIK